MDDRIANNDQVKGSMYLPITEFKGIPYAPRTVMTWVPTETIDLLRDLFDRLVLTPGFLYHLCCTNYLQELGFAPRLSREEWGDLLFLSVAKKRETTKREGTNKRQPTRSNND